MCVWAFACEKRESVKSRGLHFALFPFLSVLWCHGFSINCGGWDEADQISRLTALTVRKEAGTAGQEPDWAVARGRRNYQMDPHVFIKIINNWFNAKLKYIIQKIKVSLRRLMPPTHTLYVSPASDLRRIPASATLLF